MSCQLLHPCICCSAGSTRQVLLTFHLRPAAHRFVREQSQNSKQPQSLQEHYQGAKKSHAARVGVQGWEKSPKVCKCSQKLSDPASQGQTWLILLTIAADSSERLPPFRTLIACGYSNHTLEATGPRTRLPRRLELKWYAGRKWHFPVDTCTRYFVVCSVDAIVRKCTLFLSLWIKVHPLQFILGPTCYSVAQMPPNVTEYYGQECYSATFPERWPQGIPAVPGY